MKRKTQPTSPTLPIRQTNMQIKDQHQSSRDRLMASGLAVFNEVGVNAASIHDICKRAGVSIGSAYHHFGSKQGLADALLVEGLQSNSESLAEKLAKIDHAEAGVRTVVTSLIDWIEANPEWAKYIYAAADSSVRKSAKKGIKEVNQVYGQLILEFFQPLVRAGKMRALPLDCYFSLIIGPVHDYARRSLNGGTKKPLSAYRDLFADMAWHNAKPE